MPKITSKNKLKKRKICSQLDNLKTVKCNKKNSAVTQSTEEIKFIKIWVPCSYKMNVPLALCAKLFASIQVGVS